VHVVPSAPFDLSGRVLVSYDGRAFSSSLRWLHAQGRDEIWLSGPLGQTLAHISGDADGVLLTAADQRQYRAPSIERITREALGWELPVARLAYWVRGDIAPGNAPGAVVRADGERIVELQQDGWRVALTYFQNSEHDGLPRRLDVLGGSQQIRLVIDTWRPVTSAP
jgi:outer membrane lipoprotein LolB